jgi:hypothetical protein
MKRYDKAALLMDNMIYTYGAGNQLVKVTDSGNKATGFIDGSNGSDDYDYDANGNMTFDRNKTVGGISYNIFSLTDMVSKQSGEYLKYIYDAAGTKLSQVVYDDTNNVVKTTDYVGEVVLENNVVQFINHEEGRIVMTGNAPEYQYTLKDHLGNVRITFTTQTSAIQKTAGFETANQATEAGDFLNYPSGGQINGISANAHSGTKSLYLNGGYAGQVGLAESYSVMPGDVVQVQAYAKYSTPSGTGSNLAGFATALLNAFSLSAPVPGESHTARSAVNSWGSA